MRTSITELFGIRYPIVQGGLAHLAFAELCAAVSNAGALGQITAATVPGGPEGLRREIRRVRSLTPNPFAVNVVISAHRDSMSFVDIALSEGVTIISFTGGNPEPYLHRLENTATKTLVLVAGVRQAQKAEHLGASAVIAVGVEGGGHLGRDDIGTMVLVPRVLEAVSIPVLASGGIGNGRGLAAALAMGAAGIEMGTRFIATEECVAHEHYKQALATADETSTLIAERSLGRPGRMLRNTVSERIRALDDEPDARDELVAAIRGDVNKRAAIEGNLDEGWVWAGQVAGLIHDVPTVEQLINRMVAEAEAHIRSANAMFEG